MVDDFQPSREDFKAQLRLFHCNCSGYEDLKRIQLRWDQVNDGGPERMTVTFWGIDGVMLDQASFVPVVRREVRLGIFVFDEVGVKMLIEEQFGVVGVRVFLCDNNREAFFTLESRVRTVRPRSTMSSQAYIRG